MLSHLKLECTPFQPSEQVVKQHYLMSPVYPGQMSRACIWRFFRSISCYVPIYCMQGYNSHSPRTFNLVYLIYITYETFSTASHYYIQITRINSHINHPTTTVLPSTPAYPPHPQACTQPPAPHPAQQTPLQLRSWA